MGVSQSVRFTFSQGVLNLEGWRLFVVGLHPENPDQPFENLVSLCKMAVGLPLRCVPPLSEVLGIGLLPLVRFTSKQQSLNLPQLHRSFPTHTHAISSLACYAACILKFMVSVRLKEQNATYMPYRRTTRNKRRGLHIPLKNTAVRFILRWLKWLRENGFEGGLFSMSRQRAYQILQRYDPEKAMRLRIRRLDVIYDVQQKRS